MIYRESQYGTCSPACIHVANSSFICIPPCIDTGKQAAMNEVQPLSMSFIVHSLTTDDARALTYDIHMYDDS
jgi:hypothetical protein